jgi:hypothetical protein
LNHSHYTKEATHTEFPRLIELNCDVQESVHEKNSFASNLRGNVEVHILEAAGAYGTGFPLSNEYRVI